MTREQSLGPEGDEEAEASQAEGRTSAHRGVSS